VARLFGTNVYSSAAFGAAKPAAQTYLRCLEQLGAPAAETLFVDDSESNVSGAIDAGLQGYKFVSAAHLLDELQRRGLL
jgi:putative hydrolase of the HAD superfamily